MVYATFLLCVVSACSCNNEDRYVKEIKQLIGRNITFPLGCQVIPQEDSCIIQAYIKETEKIVTYMDDFPCTECGINAMRDCSNYVKSMDANVTYIIVVHTDDENNFKNIFRTSMMDVPIVFYSTKIFGEKNNLNVLARNKTFLLDSSNRIVLVGEPWMNKKMTSLYQRAIMALRKLHKPNVEIE